MLFFYNVLLILFVLFCGPKAYDYGHNTFSKSLLLQVTPSANKIFCLNKRNKVTNGAGEVQHEIMCDEWKL